jgi:hypothetical protein
MKRQEERGMEAQWCKGIGVSLCHYATTPLRLFFLTIFGPDEKQFPFVYPGCHL